MAKKLSNKPHALRAREIRDDEKKRGIKTIVLKLDPETYEQYMAFKKADGRTHPETIKDLLFVAANAQVLVNQAKQDLEPPVENTNNSESFAADILADLITDKFKEKLMPILKDHVEGKVLNTFVETLEDKAVTPILGLMAEKE